MADRTAIQANIAENVQGDEREPARQSGGEAHGMRLTARRAAHEGARRAPRPLPVARVALVSQMAAKPQVLGCRRSSVKIEAEDTLTVLQPGRRHMPHASHRVCHIRSF